MNVYRFCNDNPSIIKDTTGKQGSATTRHALRGSSTTPVGEIPATTSGGEIALPDMVITEEEVYGTPPDMVFTEEEVYGPSFDMVFTEEEVYGPQAIIVGFSGHDPSGEEPDSSAPIGSTTDMAVRTIAEIYGEGNSHTRTYRTRLHREETIDSAADYIESQLIENPDASVIIYGHSLGGYAALDLSRELDRRGIAVDILFTADAALSHRSDSQDTSVPQNVINSFNWYQQEEWIHFRGNPFVYAQEVAVQSHGMPFTAVSPTSTNIVNRQVVGLNHMEIDEYVVPELERVTRDYYEMISN
jgi:hypothetical protein